MPLVIVPPTERHLRTNKPRRAPWWVLLQLRRIFYPVVTRAHSRRLRIQQVDGDCLAPFLESGDIVGVDPERAAVPGDLVVVAMRYQNPRSLTSIGSLAPPPIIRESVKQLQRASDGEMHLCSAEGSVPARHHPIIGVVMYVQRRPSLTRWRCLRAPLRKMRFLPA